MRQRLLDEADLKHRPEHMMYRVMSDDLARREGAKRELLVAIAERSITPGLDAHHLSYFRDAASVREIEFIFTKATWGR